MSKHHGVIALDKKEKTIQINQTNKNDVVSVFGPPSIKSTFNDNLWIYIERETSKSSIFKFKVYIYRFTSLYVYTLYINRSIRVM